LGILQPTLVVPIQPPYVQIPVRGPGRRVRAANAEHGRCKMATSVNKAIQQCSNAAMQQ
jgi:hypothetical protein